MYMLVLQTFLLMLAAFVLGAALACFFKRSLHRFAAADAPDELLHVDVPPVVPRSATVAAATPATPPVAVSRSETQRFERALVGDVAAAAATTEVARRTGPVIEVQPLPPAPLPPPPAPETPIQYVETYESTLPPLPAQDPGPEPVADIPLVAREQDAEASSSSSSYAEETLAAADGALAAGETYNAIAVASHDGSTLPPPGVVEATLPPPTMPGPAPEPLPIPRAEIPDPIRPEEAPEPPHRSYIDDALAAGAVYVPQPEVPAPEFELSPSLNPDDFTVPPEGETYASVALGGGASTASSDIQPVQAAEAPVEEPAYETKATHVATALAAAAGIAAERATAGSSDTGDADDLTRIQGIDGVIASRLNYAGVTRFSQIANWTADDVRRMSQTLGFFGRIQDEYWIDQARLLSGGPAPEASSSLTAPSEDRPPPAPEPAAHATPAGAADIATAAAAAAAAAMVAQYSRPAPQPTRPAKLADAIRDHSEHDAPSEQETGDDVPVAATEPDAAPVDNGNESSDSAETSARSGVTGLRSVRSEALLGDDAEYVRGDLEDLKRIRGIGVLIEKKLNSLGITSYEQVANWSATDVERISEILDFKGRIERENWIEQARILASGGQTEFSRRVDRGEA